MLSAPAWEVVGVDNNPEAIRLALQAKKQLGLPNVSFIQGDFLTYQPDERYDAVLSVASAHYLVNDGRGAELFEAFRSWLQPGGKLLLLGPRCREEVRALNWLPAPMSKNRNVFSEQQLRSLCYDAGLTVEGVWPVCFTLATVSTQVRALKVYTSPGANTLSTGVVAHRD